MKPKTDRSIIQLVIVSVGIVVMGAMISHVALLMMHLDDRDLGSVVSVGLGGLIGFLARTATEDHPPTPTGTPDNPLTAAIQMPAGQSVPVTEVEAGDGAGS